MKKTIIITHGNFGEELKKSAEMIIGEAKDTYSFSLNPGDSMENIAVQIEGLINEKDEFLIFVDIFGGTPYNISCRFLNNKNVKILTGVNLPMFLEYCINKEADVDILVEKGRQSIVYSGCIK